MPTSTSRKLWPVRKPKKWLNSCLLPVACSRRAHQIPRQLHQTRSQIASQCQKRSSPLHPRLNCLTSCGLRDGLAKAGQFCIDIQLSAAFRGEVDKGLFSAVKTRCHLAMLSARCRKPFNICLTALSPQQPNNSYPQICTTKKGIFNMLFFIAGKSCSSPKVVRKQFSETFILPPFLWDTLSTKSA